MDPLPITITSDELNCLIYSYFQDSGFNHSAFALRNEGRLQSSPIFGKHVPRGELINLLGKAMLYMEVESHWRADGLTTTCKSPFSLLEPHVCSLDSPEEREDSIQDNAMDIGDTHSMSSRLSPPPGESSYVSSQQPDYPPTRNGTANTNSNSYRGSDSYYHQDASSHLHVPNVDANSKRKTSPVPTQGNIEKRARHMSVDMDVDEYPESVRSKTPQDPNMASESGFEEAVTELRPRGPGDKTDPRVVLLLDGHRTEVFVCAFNPKMHNILASGSKDSSVNLWDLPDPPPWNSTTFASDPPLPHCLENVSQGNQGDLTCLHWNSAGTLLAIGSYDSILRVYTNTGQLYFSHPQHQGPIFSTRFSKDDKWLLSGSLDGTACVWDVQEKRLHKQYQCHKDCCLDIEWINDTTFASAGADMNIFIMRIDDDEPIKTLIGHKDEINQIRVNPSGTRLASCSDDGTACVWKVDNLDRDDVIPGLSASDHRVVLKGHKHSVSSLGWCVDHPAGTNELVASTSFDGTARLWDSVTGECLHVFRDHKAPVYAITFSPDGKFLATGSGDGWLHIYHVRTYSRIWSWYAGKDRPGVFEIDWQEDEGVNRIAMALECRSVAVLDLNKLEAYRLAVQEDRRPTARIEH